MGLVETLRAGAERLGLILDGEQLTRFRRYYQLLVHWNQRVNLTAITELERVQTLHFLDSLSVALVLPPAMKAGGLLLDVGTGAGFPGVPLKVVFPGMALTLLESVGKKVAFLQKVVADLGLQGVQVCAGRAEELPHDPGLREAFDVVVSRALARMGTLAELTLPFARTGGLVVAQKKGDIQAELEEARAALDVLGGAYREVKWLSLPGLEEPRALVVIDKTSPTPASFPRRPGIPAKRPLGRGPSKEVADPSDIAP